MTMANKWRPIETIDSLRARVAELEAQNARLRENVESAKLIDLIRRMFEALLGFTNRCACGGDSGGGHRYPLCDTCRDAEDPINEAWRVLNAQTAAGKMVGNHVEQKGTES